MAGNHFMTVREAAKQLELSTSMLYRWVQEDKIKTKVDTGKLMVSLDEAAAYAKSREEKGGVVAMQVVDGPKQPGPLLPGRKRRSSAQHMAWRAALLKFTAKLVAQGMTPTVNGLIFAARDAGIPAGHRVAREVLDGVKRAQKKSAKALEVPKPRGPRLSFQEVCDALRALEPEIVHYQITSITMSREGNNEPVWALKQVQSITL